MLHFPYQTQYLGARHGNERFSGLRRRGACDLCEHPVERGGVFVGTDFFGCCDETLVPVSV